MQVVLLEDVKAFRKKGSDCECKWTLCQKFHFCKKLGVEANSKNLNDLKLKKANDDRIAAEQLAENNLDTVTAERTKEEAWNPEEENVQEPEPGWEMWKPWL